MENSKLRLDYPIYDRQLTVFYNATETLVAGWHEYSATELTMDLRSLCIKSARLCYMADLDVVWQQEDLTRSRSASNQVWQERFHSLLTEHLAPMITEVTENFHRGMPFVGVRLPRYDGEFADILPHLQSSLTETGAMDSESCTQLIAESHVLQSHLKKRKKKKQEGETPEERFWHLAQLYALTCYLYYHFHKMSVAELAEPDKVETERLLVRAIQEYKQSEAGQLALRTYRARLLFENDDRMLSREELAKAGKSLINEIPESLQYCYMAHRNDTARMAAEILAVHPEAADIQAFIKTIAKWQLIGEMIYDLEHPGTMPTISNTIFNVTPNGKPVNPLVLRKAIGEMVKLVEHKNQWFCVWCVLKHRNLLSDYHFQAFADQMMHPDWFGKEKVPTFKGENISDYSDYLGQTDFTLWNLKAFQEYRTLHNKPEKKWSDTLFKTFHHLCYEMDEIYKKY